jgi:NitT/TauT family transport system ATP-binding protein
MSTISFRDVSKTYQQGDRRVDALKSCSLTIHEGEFLSLLGPSGTGKTTLLNLVAGFERPNSGHVQVDDRPVGKPGPDRAVVFQSPTLFPWLSALDNVAVAVARKGVGKKERREIAAAHLQTVGLAASGGRHPYQMSGGMQQRVGIARALAMEPKVLLMDEPFAALDTYVRREMQDLVIGLQGSRSITTLFVTHSIEEAIMLSSKIGIMHGGNVAEVFDVPFDYPRDVTSVEFNELRREIDRHITSGVHNDRALT